MSKWKLLPVLLIAAGTVSPAAKTKHAPISIDELEQLLAADRGQPDRKVAGQLAGLELGQRASQERLTQWAVDFRGNRTRQALVKIADSSAFLDLPAADVSSAPAPDPDAQKQILLRAMDYLSKALPKLPDFSATRETMRFEDTPAQQGIKQSVPMAIFARRAASPIVSTPAIDYEPLHFVGRSDQRVTYRDGAEVVEEHGKRHDSPGHDSPGMGLTTSGEFGPILGMVIGDVAHGDIRWGYWQKRADGTEAVFRYHVPQADARYRVDLSTGLQKIVLLPAYHGEIAIDAAGGAILRISVVAELAPPYEMAQAAIAVDYAPVAIGQQTYICPVRGVAISKRPVDLVNALANAPTPAPIQTWLNDIAFSDYHLFRAETRILP